MMAATDEVTNSTRRVLLLAALTVAAFVGIVLVATVFVSREVQRARAAQSDVQRTWEILEQVQLVRSSVQDAESAAHGYVISTDPGLVESYRQADRLLEFRLQGLRDLVQDVIARSLVDELAASAAVQMALHGRAIEMRDELGQAAAVAFIRDGRGAQQSVDVRGLVERIRDRERELLEQRAAIYLQRSIRTEVFVRYSLGATALLILVVGTLLVRHVRARLQAERAATSAQAAYRDQATRLASILDNVVDAIVTINESGSIESWSKGAERLFGYPAEEVLRRNVRMLMPDPHASAHDGYLRHYMQTGERRIIGMRREVEALHKDGRHIPVDLGISEMRIGGRRLFIGIVRDISVRLEMERLKSGFVSTVSHELRTPLTSIAGSLGLLAGGIAGALPAKAARLIDIAKLNSDRLVRLINDILDLEKAESGKLGFQLQSLRLKPIVQQAVELNRAFAQAHGVVVEIGPDCDDAQVLVDQDRLIQVLTNLLSNAVKFSPRDGLVRVSIAARADNVRVSVRDQGPGIAPAFHDRVFEKFAQADSSDSRAKGGTGLGLSIARTLIERLGGSIRFENLPQCGAVFYIILPIRHEPSIASWRVEGESAPAVLVCEDDPDIAEVLTETLRRQGIRAEAVSDAGTARAALDATRFDLVIVDLNLPDADGLEFVAELRAREATRSLPIIVATARSQTASDAARIGVLQIGDWLQKPVDPQRLLAAIRSLLSGADGGRASILHVEDDASLTALVRELLEGEADVVAAHSLTEARERVNTGEYDLVILDIALGDGSGLDVLPLLREKGRTPPVILYSAAEASHEVTSLVQAALVKSRDSIEQLLASVRALTRASRANVSERDSESGSME